MPGFQEISAYRKYSDGITAAAEAMRVSISCGEVIFNSRSFPINRVTGLTDIGETIATSQAGTCSTCHNNANVGNTTFNDPAYIGIGDNSSRIAGQTSANGLSTLTMTPISRYSSSFVRWVRSTTSAPVVANGVTYDEHQISDPGIGWITGSWNDLGKIQGFFAERNRSASPVLPRRPGVQHDRSDCDKTSST